jgi:putative redox protein
MREITVRHADGDRFEVDVRDHVLTVDQPFPAGGDAGPTPVELFVASLAACVAALARRYLARHGLPVSGLTVTAEHEATERPTRVTAIRLALTLPDGVPEARRRALLAVAAHCTVHNSLRTPPAVTITLAQSTRSP